MPKIRRETAVDLSVAAIRQQVLDGDIKPGDRITEEAMAADLDVSRATIRQALNTLLVEGALTRHPSTRVLQVTTVTPDDVRDIYRARRVLELAGVDAAATAAVPELQRLQAAVVDMRRGVEAGDLNAFVAADTRCHSLTVGFLGSRLLVETHAQLMSRLRLTMTRAESADGLATQGLARHEEFCRLILARQTALARTNLADRLDEAEQSLLKATH